MKKHKTKTIAFNKTKVRIFDSSWQDFNLPLEERQENNSSLSRLFANDLPWAYFDNDNLFISTNKTYAFIPDNIPKVQETLFDKRSKFLKGVLSTISIFSQFLGERRIHIFNTIGSRISQIYDKLLLFGKAFHFSPFPTWNQLFIAPSSVNLEVKSSLAGFVVITLLVQMLIPAFMMANQGFRIKDNVSLQVAAGKRLLEEGDYENLQQMSDQFAAVSDGLNTTSQDLQALQGNLSAVIRVVPGIALLNDAQKMTNHGSRLSQLTSEFLRAMEPFMQEGVEPFDSEEDSLIEALEKVQETSNTLHRYLAEVNTDLKGVSTLTLPADMTQHVNRAQNTLPQVIRHLEEVDIYFDILLDMLGADRNRRYLFLFQNNQELRATGGFIGSYGEMTMSKGNIESLEIEEIYNPDGQMNEFIQPPQPLQDLTPRWFLRDANWFPHFPTSARQIIDMYEHTGGATPDGIITITPTMIEFFLEITGPIEMKDYGEVVTADNFLELTQYETSENYQNPDNPKQFIADLAPKMLSQVMESEKEDFSQIIQKLVKAIEQRHIMMYFQNQDLQHKVSEMNLAGEVYETKKDYLMINHNNIGGYKTDGVMQDRFDMETEITDNGEVINTVTVRRKHNGGNTDFEGWNEDNINYMRIYTPQGAQLLNASGFEDRELKEWDANIESYDRSRRLRDIERSQERYQEYNLTQGQESGKDVFSGWVTTEPQETSEVRIRYKLPFRVNEESLYSFILQKQSGVDKIHMNHALFLPEKWSLDWVTSSSHVNQDGDMIQYRTQKARDHYLGIQVTE